MSELDKLSRNDAITALKKMRNRARNAALDKQRFSRRAVATALQAGSAFAMGWFMGGREHEFRQALAAAGLDPSNPPDTLPEGFEDPRKIAGIDIDLAIGLGLTVGSLTGMLGSKMSDMLESVGTGVLAGYAYMRGSNEGAAAAAKG